MQQPVVEGVRDRSSRALAVVGGSVLFLGSALAYVALARYYRAQMWFMIDLDVYRWGGDQARHVGELYGTRYSGFLNFTYPPFSAVVFTVLAPMSIATLRNIAVPVNLALVVGCVWIVLGMLGTRDRSRRVAGSLALGALLVWIEPVQQTLQLGQVNLALMAVLLLDFSRPDTARAKGVGIGAAAAFKLTPAIFVVHLVLTRRIRAAKVALGSFVVCTALGAVVLPGESAEYWFGGRFGDSSRVGGVSYIGNQSLHGLVERLLGGRHAEPLFYALAGVVGVAGTITAARADRRHGELIGVLMCALTGLLVSPISWSHHWVWLVPAITVLAWHGVVGRSVGAGLAAVAVLALTAAWTDRSISEWVPRGVIWHAPYESGRELRWSAWQLVYGDLYVIAGLIGLGAAFWLLVARPAGLGGRGRPALEPAGRSWRHVHRQQRSIVPVGDRPQGHRRVQGGEPSA